jgi:hypothetical protein
MFGPVHRRRAAIICLFLAYFAGVKHLASPPRSARDGGERAAEELHHDDMLSAEAGRTVRVTTCPGNNDSPSDTLNLVALVSHDDMMADSSGSIDLVSIVNWRGTAEPGSLRVALVRNAFEGVPMDEKLNLLRKHVGSRRVDVAWVQSGSYETAELVARSELQPLATISTAAAAVKKAGAMPFGRFWQGGPLWAFLGESRSTCGSVDVCPACRWADLTPA